MPPGSLRAADAPVMPPWLPAVIIGVRCQLAKIFSMATFVEGREGDREWKREVGDVCRVGWGAWAFCILHFQLCCISYPNRHTSQMRCPGTPASRPLVTPPGVACHGFLGVGGMGGGARRVLAGRSWWAAYRHGPRAYHRQLSSHPARAILAAQQHRDDRGQPA